MINGSCLCGHIKFVINGEVKDIVCCHCSQCRKAQGSAFATNGNVSSSQFSFISGEDNLSEYAYSESQSKFFCKTCGSPVISKNTQQPENIRIRLGLIETDIHERPNAHIFVGSKANWETICDDLPQHKEY
ncbi:MAG: GFA family protein [Woeseiaceae bacterium]